VTAARKIAYTSAADGELRRIKSKNWRTFDKIKADIAKQAAAVRPAQEVKVGIYRIRLTAERDRLTVSAVTVEVSRYRITIRPSAQKQLDRIKKTNRRAYEQIKAKIDALAHKPRPDGVKKMMGRDYQYRIKVGTEFRVVYEIDDDELLVLILEAGDRKNVY
jgi:mRNA interferase RelE/StbE